MTTTAQFYVRQGGRDQDGYRIQYLDGSELVFFMDTATIPAEELTPHIVSAYAYDACGSLVSLGERSDNGEIERMELAAKADAYELFAAFEALTHTR